ncbi:MAG TPA: acetylxylan esterase, partial [Roseimicrobium sp.]|nr:acetylxylan esterase [Roseimicrobium sp.]
MSTPFWKTLCLCAPALVVSITAATAGEFPESDTRAATIQTLNTPRTFPAIHSKKEWQSIAQDVREQTLVSCGLWPMPEKHPLNAVVSGRVERDGYTIEKVQFESHPGLYVGGNLYRPLRQGKGPFPGVLNPHGHWKNGRMADEETGSIAARCITMARNGMVAFSYDMVGYNDTFFPEWSEEMKSMPNFAKVHRQFATNAIHQLWTINLMGLQTWNSVRALDFLESLPDVDKKRLACTGESGGGTQTFILGAIDDRLAMQAPIVMVSHSMQGGCLCENAPGLRVKHSSMEIAAAAAPRRQIMVAATGDWTKTTMTIEGPAVASVYKLFNAEKDHRYFIFNYPHNYNHTTRGAVYEAFDDWLLPANKTPVMETAYVKDPDAELRVFPSSQLPKNAVTEKELIKLLQADHQAQ